MQFDAQQRKPSRRNILTHGARMLVLRAPVTVAKMEEIDGPFFLLAPISEDMSLISSITASNEAVAAAISSDDLLEKKFRLKARGADRSSNVSDLTRGDSRWRRDGLLRRNILIEADGDAGMGLAAADGRVKAASHDEVNARTVKRIAEIIILGLPFLDDDVAFVSVGGLFCQVVFFFPLKSSPTPVASDEPKSSCLFTLSLSQGRSLAFSLLW
mmetsp:Transcript_42039/g.70150  ORF Transcript_42039/g.70150 Transcript_42039/m.70150 type:complete len:214 (-) Transcript_42039:68-709(-)